MTETDQEKAFALAVDKAMAKACMRLDWLCAGYEEPTEAEFEALWEEFQEHGAPQTPEEVEAMRARVAIRLELTTNHVAVLGED